MPRLGLVRHRIGETIDPLAFRRLAAEGCTLNRAAQVFGIHWTTAARLARAYRVRFPVHYRGYGWRGVERS